MLEKSLETSLLELTAECHRVRPATAAKLLKVTRARVGRAINHLESEGLVHSMPHPNDSRATVIYLTTAGARRALEAKAEAPCPGC